ncbi:flavin monooxygenase-like protein [Flagelloscypha sp. PMI_526]|nr:flavin monooxygenase-like protein [Flagelloscypha sp. PMI_526]
MPNAIPSRTQVVVVGAGAAGLTALKNLREVGLSAIALDDRVAFGGVWRYTDDPTKTSVIRTTQTNSSKQWSSYTDYPFSKDAPNFPSWEEITNYLEGYVEKFELRKYIFAGTEVVDVRRKDNSWEVKWVKKRDGESVEEGVVVAEKVVIATGQYRIRAFPNIPGSEAFKGVKLHAQAYKDREPFRGKKVVVVGLSATGIDTACDLVGCASQVYLSHRHGLLLSSRESKRGLPFDHLRTMRGFRVITYMEHIFPSIQDYILNSWVLRFTQWKLEPLDPKWKLTPALSPLRYGAAISECLTPKLKRDEVMLIGQINQFTGPHSLEIQSRDDHSKSSSLDDIDAVIFATGYRPTYDLISSHRPDRSAPSNDDLFASYDYPRTVVPQPTDLYWNIFDTEYPTSLAYVGHLSAKSSAFPMFDVVSMCIGQVFSGQYTLPPPKTILAETQMKNEWYNARIQGGPQLYASVPTKGLWAFLDEVSGAGLGKNLKWWHFWGLKGLVMGGIDTAFVWRLFEGKGRKAWDGAEAAIREANVVVPNTERREY